MSKIIYHLASCIILIIYECTFIKYFVLNLLNIIISILNLDSDNCIKFIMENNAVMIKDDLTWSLALFY